MNGIDEKPLIVTVVGPTSSGKTSLSIEIAKHFDGEIISADSRQVYRDLDLSSGKVTKEEMEDVPHHLLDVVDVQTVYSGADFKRDADLAVSNILNHNRLPIIAGGTFFYIELLRGTMSAAPVPPNETLRATLEVKSSVELLDELRIKDPVRAENIDPENRRRLIRALEIIEALGVVPEQKIVGSAYRFLNIGIDIDKKELHRNIHVRLLQRLDAGMVEEIQTLIDHGVTHERLQTLGLECRYVSLFLQNKISHEEMIETLETKTRQFAKRQMTWLKKDHSINWFKKAEIKDIFELIKHNI